MLHADWRDRLEDWREQAWPPRDLVGSERTRGVTAVGTPWSAVRVTAQVRRHGARLAVLGTSGALTYEALDRRANGVAHALLARGGEMGEAVYPLSSFGGVGETGRGTLTWRPWRTA